MCSLNQLLIKKNYSIVTTRMDILLIFSTFTYHPLILVYSFQHFRVELALNPKLQVPLIFRDLEKKQ